MLSYVFANACLVVFECCFKLLPYVALAFASHFIVLSFCQLKNISVHFQINAQVNHLNVLALKALLLYVASAESKRIGKPALGIHNAVTGNNPLIGVFVQSVAYCPAHSAVAERSRYIAVGRDHSLGNLLDKLINPALKISHFRFLPRAKSPLSNTAEE